jgi:hypothetical protein
LGSAAKQLNINHSSFDRETRFLAPAVPLAQKATKIKNAQHISIPRVFMLEPERTNPAHSRLVLIHSRHLTGMISFRPATAHQLRFR